jgi:general secretion pathway protein E
MMPSEFAMHHLYSVDQQYLRGFVNDGIIAQVDALLYRAIEHGASDIHLQPHEHSLVVRERIDGQLCDLEHVDKQLAPLIVSRIKILARMDIAQRRLPQDGRAQVVFHSATGAERTIDIRVASFPTLFGEKLVLRLLDQEIRLLTMDGLGLTAEIAGQVRQCMVQPHGLVLVTGPTGCGKTTMLYAMLTQLNQRTKNIVTIEDPIEYTLPGIAQSQVNVTAGFTFASGLRALLRQDPDIIMLGEIRDAQTARIAMEAALTGHLVFSTLHTNDAPSAITRLLEMGIEPFLISATLTGVLAQRLVRVLCNACKCASVPSPDERVILDKHYGPCDQVFKPVGCTVCKGHGFKGQTGIFQLLIVDNTLRALITANDVQGLQNQLVKQGLQSLLWAGLHKVATGITSIDEVLAVAQ